MCLGRVLSAARFRVTSQLPASSPSERDLTEEEKEQLAELDRALAAVDAEIESAEDATEKDADQVDALHTKRFDLEEEKEELESNRYVPDEAQQARAGALVYINHAGEIVVQTDVLRPADAKDLESSQINADGDTPSASERTHSSALMLRLTARRTLALRAVFARTPDVVLAATVHALALPVFYGVGHSHSPLGVTARKCTWNSTLLI